MNISIFGIHKTNTNRTISSELFSLRKYEIKVNTEHLTKNGCQKKNVRAGPFVAVVSEMMEFSAFVWVSIEKCHCRLGKLNSINSMQQ